MAYTTCIVSSCKTRRNPCTLKCEAVKCFSIPKDPELRKEWLARCKAEESETSDSSKKVCIKHFVETDFEDGMKARLMNLQPRILKKDAVPSLHLKPAEDNENSKAIRLKKEVERLAKILKQAQEDEMKPRKRPIKNDPNDPKQLQLISTNAQKMPVLTIDSGLCISSKSSQLSPTGTTESIEEPSYLKEIRKFLQQDDTPNKTKPCVRHYNKDAPVKKFKGVLTEGSFIKLQQDVAVYQRRINQLLLNEEKLQKKIRKLESKIEYRDKNFDKILRKKLSKHLSSTQVDIILGKLRPTWSNLELAKTYILYHISKKAYLYVKDTLGFPMPVLSTMRNWLSKMGAQLVTNDTGLIPPLPEHVQSIFNKIQQDAIINNENAMAQNFGINGTRSRPKAPTMEITIDGVCQTKKHHEEFNANLDIVIGENVPDIHCEPQVFNNNDTQDDKHNDNDILLNNCDESDHSCASDHNFNIFNLNLESYINNIDALDLMSEDFDDIIEFHELPPTYNNAIECNMLDDLNNLNPSFLEKDNG